MDSPQPTSSTALSSPIDADEEDYQEREIFIGLVRDAAKLIYGSTVSSSRTESMAENIERYWELQTSGFCGTTLAKTRFIHMICLDGGSG